MSAEAAAFVVLAVSGLLQAVFALPIKHTRGWRWEQVWTAQSITANVLFPVAWAVTAPSAFWREATRIPASHWTASYGWGLLWGIGGIAYGLSLTRLGMAFANSFIFGVTIVTGALLPLILGAVDPPVRPAVFVAALILCVVATALLGMFRRSGASQPMLLMPFRLESYRKVVAVALISGFASAGYGLAFAFRFATLRNLGGGNVSPFSWSLAVLLPVYLGGATVAIPVGIWCASRSGSLSLFLGKHSARNWTQALLMGLCAAGTAVCYNLGSTMDGHPAPNVSFCIFVTFIVLGGIVLGFATGEMHGNTRGTNAGLLLSACGLVTAAWFLNAR